MNKDEKEIAKFTINAAKEICKTLKGFNELSETSKALTITFVSIAIFNKAFYEIEKYFK